MLARLAIALVGGLAVIAVLLVGLSLLVSSGEPAASRGSGGVASVFEAWFERRNSPRTGFELTEYGAIVPARSAPDLIRQCVRGSIAGVDGYWRPTRARVLELEARLPQFIDERTGYEPLDSYARQYGGVVISGRGLIYVGLWSGVSRERLQREVITRCDGGVSVRGLVFDIETNLFSEVQATAPAAAPVPQRGR